MIAIRSAGMVTSIGLSADATCSAIRAGARNMKETGFRIAGGAALMAAQVPLPRPWRGRVKLTRMLASAIGECIEGLAPPSRMNIPLVLCLAEEDRLGRPQDLSETAAKDVEALLHTHFHALHSTIISLGRAGGIVALKNVRSILADREIERVLLAGVDSLLVGSLLARLDDEDRLLTPDNSNGFIPGEAAACVLLERAGTIEEDVICVGEGIAREPTTIYSDEPFRADGLTRAILGALHEAKVDLGAHHLRLADLSGEHYYFREAALAISRLLRSEGCTELWHPSECVGEIGAAIGPLLLGYAAVAARKHYLPGDRILIQCGSDSGIRAAACLLSKASTDVQ